tara:strand:+ start:2534 stop:3322 length:789 start_codon:yes stop_codon:yes gene_type:complete
MKKILKKIKGAYQKGFKYTTSYVYWHSKFFIFRLLKIKIVTTRYGVKCYSDYDDATFKYYFIGTYGFFYSNFLKYYPTDFIFIDVGANKGLYSLIAGRSKNCIKIISFEPIQSTFNHLEKNCLMNNILHKCDLHNFAISDTNEKRDISFNKYHTGIASLAVSNENKHSQIISINSINKTKLNNLIDHTHNDYIVKIDVEGFELTVIRELLKCDFANSITNIFYEVDERWMSPIPLEKILSEYGFNNFEKDGTGTHYNVMATR